MNPLFKSLRDRRQINRPITFSSTRKRLAQPFEINDPQKLTAKSILEMADKIKGFSALGEVLGKYTVDMEERDHYSLLDAPLLSPHEKQRQREIKVWLGDVCRRVFSTSFQFFKEQVFDSQTMKAFCSESFIGNILQLSKNNVLSPDDFKLINSHLEKQLLPYFLLRYPQSNNKEVNQNLNKLISKTDAIETNENDMFMKSGVQFEYRQDGFYYDQIMKFINYLLELSDMKLQESGGHRSETVFDRFFETMQGLFKSVQNRKWTQTDLYDHYSHSNEDVATLRQKVQELEQKTLKKQNPDKEYADAVSDYTKYAINRKLSENIPLFTEQDIMYGNIEIKNNSVLRIIVKWCSELQDKFKPDYFIDRDQPFVMKNKGEVDMVSNDRECLNLIAQAEWKQIRQFLQSVQKHINRNQSSLSFPNLMFYSENRLPEFQESVIKFAGKNTTDFVHYSIAYINRLIHGLLKISKRMFEKHLKQRAEWQYCPQLITFTISDLIRCKCFSQEAEIIRIYKQLQIQSQIAPEKIRIVRVKNRLNRGTKDILLNVLFYEKMLCEIQLAIKVDITNFILYSDKFNHYVYELMRSIFGPINEMCSIWSTSDERSTLLKNEKIFQPLQKFHKCEIDFLKNHPETSIEQILLEEILPFTCNKCEKHYSQSKYIFYHKVCYLCKNYWLCALCRMNKLSQQELMKELSLDEASVLKKVQKKEDLPQYIIIYKIQSAYIRPITCRIFEIDKNKYMISKQHHKLKVVNLKNFSTKESCEFLQQFMVFGLKKPDEELAKLTLQEVQDYLVLEEIEESYNKKWEAIRITSRNITKELLLKIDDPRGQQGIKNLSFPENKIDELEEIGERFKNVRFLNLNGNGLKSLKGIGNMTGLTDLYLGFNEFTEIVDLQNLKKLKFIDFSHNPNAPVFKCDLSGLQKVESLILTQSNLSSFPQAVLNLQNLKMLWLNNNNIKIIPEEISQLSNLEDLKIGINQIKSLPESLFKLNNLQKLHLWQNELTSISVNIANLTNLQEISLYANQISEKDLPIKQIDGIQRLSSIQLDRKLQNTIKEVVPAYNLNKYAYY